MGGWVEVWGERCGERGVGGEAGRRGGEARCRESREGHVKLQFGAAEELWVRGVCVLCVCGGGACVWGVCACVRVCVV